MTRVEVQANVELTADIQVNQAIERNEAKNLVAEMLKEKK